MNEKELLPPVGAPDCLIERLKTIETLMARPPKLSQSAQKAKQIAEKIVAQLPIKCEIGFFDRDKFYLEERNQIALIVFKTETWLDDYHIEILIEKLVIDKKDSFRAYIYLCGKTNPRFILRECSGDMTTVYPATPNYSNTLSYRANRIFICDLSSPEILQLGPDIKLALQDLKCKMIKQANTQIKKFKKRIEQSKKLWPLKKEKK